MELNTQTAAKLRRIAIDVQRRADNCWLYSHTQDWRGRAESLERAARLLHDAAEELDKGEIAMKRPIAIDPPGCGCTECITGEYVPLINATAEQITDMLAGRLGNNTGCEFSITFTGKFDDYPKRPFSLADAETVIVSTTFSVRTRAWDIAAAFAGWGVAQ